MPWKSVTQPPHPSCESQDSKLLPAVSSMIPTPFFQCALRQHECVEIAQKRQAHALYFLKTPVAHFGPTMVPSHRVSAHSTFVRIQPFVGTSSTIVPSLVSAHLALSPASGQQVSKRAQEDQNVQEASLRRERSQVISLVRSSSAPAVAAPALWNPPGARTPSAAPRTSSSSPPPLELKIS